MAVMRRLLVLGLLCGMLECGSSIAEAAPVYVTLGHVGSSANALSAGGCTLCTAWQIASPGAVSYTFPYDGVITRWSVHTGQSVQTPPDTARARVFQLVDSGHARLVA